MEQDKYHIVYQEITGRVVIHECIGKDSVKEFCKGVVDGKRQGSIIKIIYGRTIQFKVKKSETIVSLID